jgi:hypothetical protein
MNNLIDFYELAKHKKLNTIDPKLLTETNVLQIDEMGDMPLHYAAVYGSLNQIPQEILTEKNLLETDADHHNSFAHAAQTKNLNQIPYIILLKCKNECLRHTTTELYEKALTEAKETYKKELILKIKKTKTPKIKKLDYT